MLTDKNTAAVSFALMVFTGLIALTAEGFVYYSLAACSAFQAYFFIVCILDHLDQARGGQNRDAATRNDATG